jgi:glycosyltransferase involved in cell wall biosynthesis
VPDPDLPLVSIVTPSFNQARYLEATICSVLDQDYPRLEYIVIDGGSTDGSLELIQRYAPRLAHWVSEPDLGQADAINKGFAVARGAVFAWLNSDDVYRPGAVSEAVAYLTSHPEIGMVYSQAFYIDEAGAPIARYPAGPTDHRGLRRGITTIPQQTTFFRSRVWRIVGPLDPAFYYAMDYDLWVRLSAVSPLAFVPRVWAGFRIHDLSKSRREASRCWPEMMRVHFRDGGGRLSILYAKSLVRRVVEPIMPWRLTLRRWRFSLEGSHEGKTDGVVAAGARPGSAIGMGGAGRHPADHEGR